MPQYQVPAAGNQATAQDDQPYQIDIDQIYSDFIQQIDGVRSYVNVNNTTIDKKVINSLSSGSNQSIVNFLTPDNNFQESRCHAFFRLIGLPVCNSNKSLIYNPGHPLSMLARHNTLDFKLQVAGDQLSGFRNFSIAREKYPLSTAAVFALTGSLNASVLALSSGSATANQSVNIRPLDFSKVTDAFDLISQHQSFKVGAVSLVGTNEIPLNQYQDINGNFSSVDLGNRNHLIFPLITDPIIDFCVNPSTRRVGIPFVPDKTYLKVASGNAYAVRPLIEKVIRDRFSNSITAPDLSLQPANQSLVSYVKDNTLLTNVSAISQTFGNDLYNVSELAQFSNFVNIINEMMKQLTGALTAIHKAQSLYYWLPSMSSSGPEAGVNVQDPFLPNNISQQLVTKRDRDLLNRIISASLNKLDQQAAQARGIPDVGGFAFESFKTTFNSDTSSSFQDGNQLSVNNMSAERKTILSQAGNGLRTVEIIMGEFSGLGLVDIIAIMGGLYLMPKNSLSGLLDQDAFSRAQSALGSATFPSSQTSYSQAMTDLFNGVTTYYAIADSILKNWTDKQGLSI